MSDIPAEQRYYKRSKGMFVAVFERQSLMFPEKDCPVAAFNYLDLETCEHLADVVIEALQAKAKTGC